MAWGLGRGTWDLELGAWDVGVGVNALLTLGDAVNILTISADLPFAQLRWCGAEGIDRVIMASDYKDMNFGDAYGTHIKELRWESRAVFVVDQEGVVRYAEYVPVVGHEPNYDAALATLRELAA